jgi:hypothetical protein
MQDSLESLWLTNSTDYDPHVSNLEPIDEPTRLQVTNLFALVDGLVQALAGEYYPNNVLSFHLPQSQELTASDPRIDYLRTPNQLPFIDYLLWLMTRKVPTKP